MIRSTFGLCATIFVAVAWPAAAQVVPAGTANPHGKFVAPCEQCHLPDTWRPTRIAAAFKHAPNRFPLEGAHARVACTACHTRLDFTGLPTTCVSCHKDAHQGELGADCARCHSTRSFLDFSQMRRAHQATAFPLTGSHLAVDCRSCHVPRAAGQFSFVNLPTTCVSCHLNEYKQTTQPAHAAGGFPTTCENCHATTAWSGVGFDHSRTQFPLTGAHKPLACAACHADGIYRGKSTACVSCHRPDYNATTNPAHAAAGFPTDCASCHNTASWAGATFNHDAAFFPIYSGAHQGVWSSCSTCHVNATNYGVFDCLSCHTKSTTDSHHTGVSGYIYASPNCYSCHRTGRAG